MNMGNFMGGFAQGLTKGREEADYYLKKQQENAIRKGVQDASAVQAVDEGVDDPALWQSDLSPEQRRQLSDQTAGLGTSRVGNRSFATPYEAQQYADQYNSIAAQTARIADVYNRYGDPEKAMELRRQQKLMDTADAQLKLQQEQFGLAKDTAALTNKLTQHQISTQEARDKYLAAVKGLGGQRNTDELANEYSAYAALGDRGREAYLAYANQVSPGALKRQQAQLAREHGQLDDADKYEKDAYAEDARTFAAAMKAANAGNKNLANVLWNQAGQTGQLITDISKGKKGMEFTILDLHTGKAFKGTEDDMARIALSPDKYSAYVESMKKASYYDRMPKAGGGSGANAGVVITPQQQAELSALNKKFYETDDPKIQASIARKLQVLQNEIAIANKRFPALGGLGKEPKPIELTFEQFVKQYGSDDPVADLEKYKDYQLRNTPVADLAARLPPISTQAPAQSGSKTAKAAPPQAARLVDPDEEARREQYGGDPKGLLPMLRNAVRARGLDPTKLPPSRTPLQPIDGYVVVKTPQGYVYTAK